MFYHEQLRVYPRLLAVVRALQQVSQQWPRGAGYLRDQGQRAVSSAVLNLAEGNQKPTSAERRRFYATSRGSLAELAAILDVAEVLGFTPSPTVIQQKAELLGVCQVLGVLR